MLYYSMIFSLSLKQRWRKTAVLNFALRSEWKREKNIMKKNSQISKGIQIIKGLVFEKYEYIPMEKT